LPTHSLIIADATTIVRTGIVAMLTSRNIHVHRPPNTAGTKPARSSNGMIKAVDHAKPFNAAPNVQCNTGSLLPDTSEKPAATNLSTSSTAIFGSASAHNIGNVSIVLGMNVADITATAFPKNASGRTSAERTASACTKFPW
jgi:hypothetical protein